MNFVFYDITNYAFYLFFSFSFSYCSINKLSTNHCSRFLYIDTIAITTIIIQAIPSKINIPRSSWVSIIDNIPTRIAYAIDKKVYVPTKASSFFN